MSKFDEEISDLKQKLHTMGSLAQASVHRAIKAMRNRDDGLAMTAKEEDKDIDELELEIDEAAIGLLPRARTPEELRLIIVVTKIARDLERVGDEATSISRRAFDLNQDAQSQPTVDIPHRADIAVRMLNEGMEA